MDRYERLSRLIDAAASTRMMMNVFAKAVVITAMGLCGCTQPSGEAPQGQGEQTAAPQSAPSPSAKQWNNGAVKPLDIQVAHPNGAVLQLTSLQSRPTDTVVGLRVINGRTRDVELNRSPSNRTSYLLLETGERLYLSPPPSNPRLSIPTGQTFEGQLVFLGRLEPVNAAVLVLNENHQTDNEHTTTPGFRIDLPVAGGGQ
ncbi:hypothetical protein ABVV53_16315 [Novosphingobium sp. RD2P27]|uniref:DUF4352 domain-containing protein n=1 Tax=Novosphingobium kalidii TaxID=3230299 RepID=A0ABV2D563_9SPHN